MTVNKSIQKTIEYLKHDFKMFDYTFFCDRIVSGLIQDGFTKVDTPVIVGEWLNVYTKGGNFKEINIYNKFDSL